MNLGLGQLAFFKNSEFLVFQLAQMNFLALSNGNRTEWSPIRSVIIGVIKKSDDSAFLYHERRITDRIGRYEVLLPINHKSYNFREKKNSQVMKKGKICIKSLTKEA